MTLEQLVEAQNILNEINRVKANTDLLMILTEDFGFAGMAEVNPYSDIIAEYNSKMIDRRNKIIADLEKQLSEI